MGWTIEGHQHPPFPCFGKTWTFAAKLAMKLKQDVIVRYNGQKYPGNQDIKKSDFVAKPNGTRDFSIDPTWAGRT